VSGRNYKRPLDLAILFSAHLILFPGWFLLWFLIPLFIWLEDRGPVFYTQERVGRNGRIFMVYKFRSMVPDAEKHTGAVWASEHDPRVTKVGRILRATAMDELPQLWNILRGDMSFVGPRAERPELVEKFARDIRNYRKRFAVRPGLTGIAQVYGRYDTPPQNKLRYDLLYVKNQSLFLDLKLIFLSVWITLKGKWESRQKKV
jgi:lipopolysaccharide/colanic/teichoic acid biosynthesis glycosyltransferase